MSEVTINLATAGNAATTSAALVGGSFATGVNLSGLEYNPGGMNRPNWDYFIPTTAELQYYHSQGVNLIRLPFSWERMQPTLNGPLNTTYIAEIEGVVNAAAALGMKVILDAHNFGGYGSNKLGDGTLTDGEFANLWQQLSSTFAGNPGIGGYDLMNEPSGMPNAQAWPQAAQAAITAIRTVDLNTPIYVEGDDFSAAGSWSQNNPTLASLVDPSNNLIFSAHLYLDNDGSGTHYDWTQQAAQGDTTQLGVQRLQNFVSWLQANNLKGDIGELGTADDNTSWLVSLDNTLALAQASNLQVTYWAGGPAVGSYPLSTEPAGDGTPASQMAILDRYSGAMETVPVAALSGTAAANTTLYLSNELGVTIATVQTNALGIWSTILTGLSAGVHTIAISDVPPGLDGDIAAISFILNPNVVVQPPVVAPAIAATALIVGGVNTRLAGTALQNTFRFVPGDGRDTVTNFDTAEGDALQVIGSGSYTVSDFHVSDIMWDYGAASPFLWQMNGTAVSNATPIGAPAGALALAGYHIAATGDFDGDGMSDLLLAPDAPNPGAPAILWFIDKDALASGIALPYAAPSAKAWSGDFNGDGDSDILWDNGSQTPYLWEMKGSAVIAAVALGGPTGSTVMPGYHIAGVGDFNDDGRSDILLAPDILGGPTVIWFMNGTAGNAVTLPYIGPSTTAWTGDFNGDGTSDILWDEGSASPVLWEMQGGLVIGVRILGGAYGGVVMPGYHIAGVGDFNGDGYADILWSANTPSFASPSMIWFTTPGSVTGLFLPYGETPTTAFIGDFNLDGALVTSGGTQVILPGVDSHTATVTVSTLSATRDYSALSAGVTANLITDASSIAGENLAGYHSIVGTPYNDTLRGDGVGYVSTLTGDGGSDIYQFGSGDGTVDIINGSSASANATGQVDFLSGVVKQDLWFAKSGNDLVIDILGSNDQLTVSGWYASGAAKVSEIVDAGGFKLDSALANLVQAMSTFSAANPAFNPQASGTTMPTDSTLQNTIASSWHS